MVLFLQIFLHFSANIASPIASATLLHDNDPNEEGSDAVQPTAMPPIYQTAGRSRSRRRHEILGSSRLVVSEETHPHAFKSLFLSFYDHPHGHRSVSTRGNMRKKLRVSLCQFDLTSSQQAFASVLKDIQGTCRWFFVDLRCEDDVFEHFSYLLVILHLLCHIDLLAALGSLLVQLPVIATNDCNINTNSSISSNNVANEALLLPWPMDWYVSVRVLSGVVVPTIVLISGGSMLVALLCQWNASEALVLMSLVALFLVECLVPLTLLASLILYVGDAMAGPSAVTVALLVWLVSVTLSRLLRRVIYPRIRAEGSETL